MKVALSFYSWLVNKLFLLSRNIYKLHLFPKPLFENFWIIYLSIQKLKRFTMPAHCATSWRFQVKSLWTYSNRAQRWALNTTVARSTKNTAGIWGELWSVAPVLRISSFLCKKTQKTKNRIMINFVNWDLDSEQNQISGQVHEQLSWLYYLRWEVTPDMDGIIPRTRALDQMTKRKFAVHKLSSLLDGLRMLCNQLPPAPAPIL